MNLSQLLKGGGRRYAVVIRTLELGFILSLVGLLVAALQPAIAQYVAAIVGGFDMLGSASIVAYQGANAAQDWKHPSATASATSHAAPPARQSGTILEPMAGP